MTADKHTPTPWRWDRQWGAIWGGDFDIEIVAPLGCQFVSDAERIVACVNACEGIPSSALESGVIGELMEFARQIVERAIAAGGMPVDDATLEGMARAALRKARREET